MKDKIIVAIVIALIGLIVFINVKQEMKWQEWAKEHCEVVGKEFGSTHTGTGFNTGGDITFMTISESDKTHYECDDGKFYIK